MGQDLEPEEDESSINWSRAYKNDAVTQEIRSLLDQGSREHDQFELASCTKTEEGFQYNGRH